MFGDAIATPRAAAEARVALGWRGYSRDEQQPAEPVGRRPGSVAGIPMNDPLHVHPSHFMGTPGPIIDPTSMDRPHDRPHRPTKTLKKLQVVPV
jgi:hypothetical protein